MNHHSSSRFGRSALALFAFASLAGCAHPKRPTAPNDMSAQLHATIEEWRGARRDLLLQVWGPPTRSAPLSGEGAVLAYDKSTVDVTTSHETSHTPVYQTAPAWSSAQQSSNPAGMSTRERTETSVRSGDCTVTFFVAGDGAIERAEMSGAPSVCAQIVRPRPDARPATAGYTKNGNVVSWERNGVRISQAQDAQTLPPAGPLAQTPLTGRFKFVRSECWQGTQTQFGKAAMENATRSIDSYVIDFDQKRAESKTGACVQRAAVQVTPHEGRWRVHLSMGTAEGCSPMSDLDRTMEITESRLLLDYNFGSPAMIARFCASGPWVQVFERVPGEPLPTPPPAP
jgi:hypothetical protein